MDWDQTERLISAFERGAEALEKIAENSQKSSQAFNMYLHNPKKENQENN